MPTIEKKLPAEWYNELQMRRLTVRKKDGAFTVRITDVKNNKTVASYETTDRDDANATADHMLSEQKRDGYTVIDTRDRSA